MMPQIALKIIFILALAATCFVVTMSFFLVLRKIVEVRTKKRSYLLFQYYSSMFANLLMEEIPAGTTNMSERWRYYETTLTDQKEKLGRMSKRTRMLHKRVIRSVLIDFSKDLKGEPTERILYYIYSLKILDELLIMMESPRWWVRASAAQELGLLHARRAVVPLTAALEDAHRDVQFQAMQSLLMIVGMPALSTIFRLSKSFSQWTAVELSVIIHENREEGVPYLLEALNSSSPSVVLFSIALLAQIGFVSAVEPLIQFCMGEPDPILYAAALDALGRLGDERALPILLQNLQNPHREMRLSAVRALGHLGAEKGIGIVTERFAIGEIDEKRIAGRALATMGNAGLSMLNELLESPDDVAKKIALEVTEDMKQGRVP
jgi:HEAT repeat protein